MNNPKNISFKENKTTFPVNVALRSKARELRKAGNLAEVIFWNHVKNKQLLGLDFDRQKIIGNYIVDFYIKKLGLVIEIDGDSHTNEKFYYDRNRENILKSFGLHIWRVKDIEVKNNTNEVIQYLKEYIIKNFT
jgi:very-short-patch-repair endonuclease